MKHFNAQLVKIIIGIANPGRDMMKKSMATLLLTMTLFSALAQEIAGDWNGVIKTDNIQLSFSFQIEKKSDYYSSKMDIPDQGAKGIPIKRTSFENFILKLDASDLGIMYEGSLQGDKIIGHFKQGGKSYNLDLSRGLLMAVPSKVRPQEPLPPFNFFSKDVFFRNEKDAITLAATLSLPDSTGNFPVVILISGSGPQNRDSEVFGHKPFLVIADYMAKNGIGVLRFDDRGVAKSEGNFKTATTTDFAADVSAAISYLKTRAGVDKNRIGLIGHSEGGIVASLVAAGSKDVKSVGMLAGPGIPGDQLLLLQKSKMMKSLGFSAINIDQSMAFMKGAYKIVRESKTLEDAEIKLKTYMGLPSTIIPSYEKAGMTDPQFSTFFVRQLTDKWLYAYIKLDPSVALRKVKCPLLAINGSNDLQVPAKENLKAIADALTIAKNKNFSTLEIPLLNHLFQESITGLTNEYNSIDQTFSPIVLNELKLWIEKTL